MMFNVVPEILPCDETAPAKVNKINNCEAKNLKNKEVPNFFCVTFVYCKNGHFKMILQENKSKTN